MFRSTLSLFTALLLTSLPALAAEPETKPDAKTERARVKVFRLKNADPNDALQAFNALVSQVDTVPVAPPVPPDTPVLPPLPAAPVPPLPPVGPQAINFKFDERRVSPAPTPMVAPTAVTCRALADPRTRSLIVRGTEKDLQLAADLVTVLDTPEDKPLPAVKSLKAFRFQHLDAKDFVDIMQALDTNISYRLAPIGRMKLLLAVGSDEQMKELADAVKELDIAAPTK